MNDKMFSAQSKGFAQDSIDATWHNDVLSITIENPWAGSTDTGFGYTCDVDLTHDDARRFGEWLLSLKKCGKAKP